MADETADLTEVYTAAGEPDSVPPGAPGLHGLVGAGLFTRQRITGDDGRRTALLPLLFMRYEDVAYWNIGGGGVWLLHADDGAFRLGLGVKLHPGWSPDDDPELQGMTTRRGSLDGSVNALWRTPVATIGSSFYHDIGSVSHGQSATSGSRAVSP